MIKAYMLRFIIPIMLVFVVSIAFCLVFHVDAYLLRLIIVDFTLLLIGMVLGSLSLWWFLSRIWLRDADQWKVLIDGVIARREKRRKKS